MCTRSCNKKESSVKTHVYVEASWLLVPEHTLKKRMSLKCLQCRLNMLYHDTHPWIHCIRHCSPIVIHSVCTIHYQYQKKIISLYIICLRSLILYNDIRRQVAMVLIEGYAYIWKVTTIFANITNPDDMVQFESASFGSTMFCKYLHGSIVGLKGVKASSVPI